MKRNASAVWTGGLKDGKGTITTATHVLNEIPYSFGTRFGEVPGTNPEELIAAAHSACYSMALSGALNAAGLAPASIRTAATVTLEKTDAGFTVTGVHLDITADIPNATPEAFETAAENARATCPISRLLNTKITKEARLTSQAGARS